MEDIKTTWHDVLFAVAFGVFLGSLFAFYI